MNKAAFTTRATKITKFFIRRQSGASQAHILVEALRRSVVGGRRSVSGTAVADSSRVQRKTRQWYFTSYRAILFSIALLGLGFAGVVAIGTAPPLWKIGRAVFEWRAPPPGQVPPGQNIPVLKLSLRNEGGAGSLPVQIFARWAAQSAPPQSFALLGSYQREVALMQTAILETPLTPLAKAPPGKLVLEVVVMTGGTESDRKWLPWN